MGLSQLEDYMPAAPANSLRADEDRESDHTTIVQVKEEEEAVTHTATTETTGRVVKHLSLQLRLGSEMTWRRSTRSSSSSSCTASSWRSAAWAGS